MKQLILFILLFSGCTSTVKLDEKFVGRVVSIKEKQITTVRRVYDTWDDVDPKTKRGDSVFLVCAVPDTCNIIRIKKNLYIIE